MFKTFFNVSNSSRSAAVASAAALMILSSCAGNSEEEAGTDQATTTIEGSTISKDSASSGGNDSKDDEKKKGTGGISQAEDIKLEDECAADGKSGEVVFVSTSESFRPSICKVGDDFWYNGAELNDATSSISLPAELADEVYTAKNEDFVYEVDTRHLRLVVTNPNDNIVVNEKLAGKTAAGVDSVLHKYSEFDADGIGPVKIGMTVNEAIAAAGVKFDPVSTDVAGGYCYFLIPTDGDVLGLDFQVEGAGEEADPDKDFVATIYVNTASHTSTKGARIGHDKADLENAYGKDAFTQRAGEYGGLYVDLKTENDDDRSIRFDSEDDGTVRQILAGANYRLIEGCA